MDHSIRKPKPGSVRWKDAIDHDHHIVEPGHESYAGALEAAQEYWDAATETWVPFSQGQVNA